MNKIKVLIDNGFITEHDIEEYIYAKPQDVDDYVNHSDDDYVQMINQLEYEEQLANELNRTDYIDAHPEYVLASTSDLMQETMVFPSNKDGDITDLDDLACLALRYGCGDWEDPIAAVIQLNTDEYKYIHVKTLDNGGNNIHNLFKRIKVSDIVVI
jgi:hypothetical protein